MTWTDVEPRGCRTTTTRCCAPIAREPVSPADTADLAAALKAVADPVRLRLPSTIGSHADGEARVCDLGAPTIPHHLKTPRTAGLVDSERRGTRVHCRIAPSAAARLGAPL